MSFVLPPVSGLLGHKADIIATSAQLIRIPAEARSAAEAARCAAVDAVAIHWRRTIKQAAEGALEEALEGYAMIEGDFEDATDVAAWHAGLTAAAMTSLGSTDNIPLLAEFHALLVDCDLQEPDRIGDVAENIAALLIEANLPAAKDVGKFLASMGIVKVDLDALAAQAPAAETTEGRVDAWKADVAEAIATGAEIPSPPAVAPGNFTPPPAPPVAVLTNLDGALVPVDAAKPLAPPDKATLGQAYRLLYEQSNCDPDVLSAALGFSRSTIMNYMTGRTAGKASADQARILVNDITRREVALREAKAIFAAVV